jgi:hypothetical protein
LTHWLRASLESFLSLIISFLVQLQHLLLPSLIVTSSQVRVGTPLPFLSCCISGLGPEGLWHNCTIPVVSTGTTQGDPSVFLAEALPMRTFHAKLNGQNAVSTRHPTMLQHPLEKQVTSSRELRSMRNSLHTHLQEPDFVFGSRVTCFSRDLFCSSTGSYVPVLQGSHM